MLERQFGDRPDGAFTVVFQVANDRNEALVARLQGVVDRAARSVPTGRPTALNIAGRHVVFGDIVSILSVIFVNST